MDDPRDQIDIPERIQLVQVTIVFPTLKQHQNEIEVRPVYT